MVKNILELRIVILCISCCLLSKMTVHGQNTLGSSPSNQLAFEYFQQKQYEKVVGLLENEVNPSADEEILLELSRLKSGTNTIKAIKKWIEQNTNHPLNSLAQFNYGEYSFYKGDSVVSRIYLSKVKPRELSKEDQASYGFTFGVLSLQTAQYKNADNLFTLSEKNNFKNVDQLTYYQSFTKYHLSDQSGALKGFERLKDHEEFGLSSRYFIAKILLEDNKLDEVISLSQTEITDEKSQTNSGFHQLIGEAYARKGDVAKADAYFDQAIKKHPGKPTPALYYQAGVSKFKIGNEDKAIEYLTEAGIGAGEYAQLSAFQLGRLYIKKGNPEKAIVAYTEASASNDPEIKEESLYQAAKLNAKLKRYTEAINYADDYLNSFRQGKWRREMQNLIAESYLRTSNYDLAIKHLEGLGLSDNIQKEVYQKVTLQKAILLFNDSNFKEAKQWFQKSLQYPQQVQLANDAYFYLGEIHLKENNYQQAIASYKRQSPLSASTQYGLGYAYYNLGNYPQAIVHFRNVSGSVGKEVLNDATLRLADCLYATKSYENALASYQKLPSNNYTLFQTGLVLRNLERNTEAISHLSKISNNSSLADDALFFKAQIQFESANFQQAEIDFSSLINRYSGSEFIVKSYLNRAISRSNLQKLELARDDYEYVIDKYIDREEAFSAILGLQELQQKGIKVGNLDKYIAQYKKVNPEGNSLEVVEFEAAKGRYFAFEYSESAVKMESFLKEYPASKFRLEAEYYLGDSYFRSNQMEKAKVIFDKQKLQQNIFTGRVLTRLGEINTQLKFYSEAAEAYNLLLGLNLSPKDNYNAKNGLLQVYYQSANYQEAIAAADQILVSDWKPLNADQQAKILKARSLFALQEYEKASLLFEELSKTEDAVAAESAYQLAWINYNKGAHETSLDMLFSLNGRFGAYGDWIDQSYLLIADNYIAMDELFQAKATLRSIMEHSKNEEIKSTANKKLLSIEGSVPSDSTQNEGN